MNEQQPSSREGFRSPHEHEDAGNRAERIAHERSAPVRLRPLLRRRRSGERRRNEPVRGRRETTGERGGAADGRRPGRRPGRGDPLRRLRRRDAGRGPRGRDAPRRVEARRWKREASPAASGGRTALGLGVVPLVHGHRVAAKREEVSAEAQRVIGLAKPGQVFPIATAKDRSFPRGPWRWTGSDFAMAGGLTSKKTRPRACRSSPAGTSPA